MKFNQTKTSKFKTIFLILTLASTLVSAGDAKAVTIDKAQSSIAVLTDKEGIAAALAHRHIIVASSWNVETLNLPSSNSKATSSIVTEGSVAINLEVKKLIVDSPKDAEKIIGVFSKNKVWDEKSNKLEPGNAETVRENMLDKSQLDAENHPSISGRGFFSNCKEVDVKSKSCDLKLIMKIKNIDVEKQSSILIVESEDGLITEFIVPYKFSDFSIKPYRAMMGAIGVKDEFFIGVKLKTDQK